MVKKLEGISPYIIVAEEDTGYAEKIRQVFDDARKPWEIKIVDSLDQAYALLKPRLPDLIISEWRQPDGHGIRPDDAARFVDRCPLLILSELEDIDDVCRLSFPSMDFIIKSPEYFDALPVFADKSIRNELYRHSLPPDAGLSASTETTLQILETIGRMSGEPESELVNYTLESIVRLTHSKFGFLHVFDRKLNGMKLHAWSGEIPGASPGGNRPDAIPGMSFLWNECILSNRPVVSNHYTNNSNNGEDSNGNPNIVRFMSLPASIADRFITILGVADKNTPYTETDIQRTALFADIFHFKLKDKRRRKYLRRTDRALKILSEFNHSLITANNEKDFLVSICKNIVEYGGYRMVWVGYADHGEDKLIIPVASYGDDDGYLENADITWKESERGRGPTGLSIRTGKPAICHFLKDDPNLAPWREEAMKRGFVSSISVPMMNKTVPIGSINIYASEPDAFNDEEVGLLVNLASDLVFGIQAIKSKIEQKSAEKEKKKLETFLRQAQKMEAIGTLAGGVAHDFNNILSVIMGYGEMIKDDLENSGVQTLDIDNILNACFRARELVNQILAFSRQAEQELQPVYMNHIIKEALKLLRPSIPSTIEFRKKIDASCGPVMADPTQIHQIVMNLCTNAYQAMKDAGGILEISLAQISIDKEEEIIGMDFLTGNFVKLTVSDTGLGMTRQVLDRIFDPYFTTKGRGEGTGLGLSVVHGIIKSLGGFIHVYSEEGNGSAFQVYLPMMEHESIPEEIQEAVIPTGRERILIVDDEKNLVELLGRMLSRLGYTVTVMDDSVKAMNEFQSRPGDFDLLITDMAMPKLNGMELSRRILELRPDIPIILCTGYSEIVNEEKASEIGVSQFIMKPIVKKILAKAVRAALD